MKKIILLCLLLLPFLTFASINQSLYYGLMKNDSVKELQQFLISKSYLTGTATGNFLTQTKNAVKKYQASKNISTTGNVGPLTIKAINADLIGIQNTSSVVATTNANTIPVSQNQVIANVPFSGSLDLTQNTSYTSQSTIIPKSKFKLAYYSLKNNTTEPINLKKIQVDLAISSDSYIVNLYISNLYATYGNSKTITTSTGMGNNNFSINYPLPVGETIDLVVYGDINSLIPLNSIINSSVLVSGTSSISATDIYTNSNSILVGQNITISTSSLNVNQDSSTPAARISLVDRKILAGKFQFTSVADSYNISELKFIIPNLNTSSIISDVILMDTAKETILATIPIKNNYFSDNSILDFNVNIPISFNSTKSITLYYIFNKSIDSNITNTNIAPILAYIKASDGLGNTIDGAATNFTNFFNYYNGIVLPVGGVTVNSLLIFKSFPTFSYINPKSTNIPNNSDIDIYNFSITADSNGSVSIKQLIFLVTLNDPARNNFYLNNFSFSKGGKDFTGSVAIGNIYNNIPVGLSVNNGIQPGLVNKIAVTFIQDEVIPAGKTETYILKAHTNNVSSQDTISTYIPADTEVLNGGSYLKTISSKTYCGLSKTRDVNISTINYYNLLWSDMSESFPNLHNNFNGFDTNDWYNGNLVSSLPLSTQTLTAQ